MTFPWMDIAKTFSGLSEIPGSDDNPKIVEMYSLCGHSQIVADEVPWCAAFVGSCLKLAGYKNTGSLMARSYEKYGERIDTPVEGCIVVFWRKSKSSGSGHVGFYAGESSSGIKVFGGNQNNKVNIKNYSRSKFLGYFLPTTSEQTNLPTNTILPTILDVNSSNAPAHVSQMGHMPTPAKKDSSMPNQDITLTAKFLAIHPWIEKWEGGYVDHPKDPGGATNMGITLDTLSRWRGRKVSKAEVRDLSQHEARQIFKAWYFDIVSGENLPAPVALAVYNSAVLSGVRRASRWLQKEINKMGETIAVDGEIGPETLGAASRLNPQDLANRYFNRYEQFLRGLGHWGTFGKGWLNRLNDLRAGSLTLKTEFVPAPAPQPQVPIPQTPNTNQGDPSNLVQLILALVLALKGNNTSASLLNNDAIAQLIKAAGGNPPSSENNLTPINRALGKGLGQLLNGRKTGLGILGLLGTSILPILVPDLADAIEMTSENGKTIWGSLSAALLSWGLLGKTEKWVAGK